MDLSNLNFSSLPSWLVAIIVIITAVATHYLKPLLDYLKGARELSIAQQKEKDSQTIAANQQALIIYQDIVKGLRDDMARLEVYNKEKIEKLEKTAEILEKEHMTCREESATQKLEIKFLKEEMRRLQKIVAENKQERPSISNIADTSPI